MHLRREGRVVHLVALVTERRDKEGVVLAPQKGYVNGSATHSRDGALAVAAAAAAAAAVSKK